MGGPADPTRDARREPSGGTTGGSSYRTVAEILAWTRAHFESLGIPSARLDAEVLLAHALGLSRMDLYTGHGRPLDGPERDRFRDFVKRRSRREPVAYITGEKEFFSLPFAVSPAVLVPRPETEHLVEWALELIEGLERPRVLDIGTGSGNIAVTIAVRSPNALVDAIDQSAAALAVAATNAARHGVADRVRLVESDLFAALGGRRYDLIASNPPYVREEELDGLAPEVRVHEPARALLDTFTPPGDGLGFYRAIIATAAAHLLPGGRVIVETGEGQAAPVAAIFAHHGFTDVDVRRDYARIERVVAARGPSE